MKKIASFEVDHRYIQPGVYISRVDGDITTYDLRFTRPNVGEYLENAAIHTLEHLLATYIRNSAIADDVIYLGPMGCRTGFYLLLRNANNATLLPFLTEIFQQVAAHTGEVFGVSEIECGNCAEHCLDGAIVAAKGFLATLATCDPSLRYPS
ncbi:MAG: S-ribosylhomocysteine lyase [Oscillospiraceae bacterium]|nr:S-ribosylhomocysteine lyase [Oscillospiraceae bacterium]